MATIERDNQNNPGRATVKKMMKQNKKAKLK